MNRAIQFLFFKSNISVQKCCRFYQVYNNSFFLFIVLLVDPSHDLQLDSLLYDVVPSIPYVPLGHGIGLNVPEGQ